MQDDFIQKPGKYLGGAISTYAEFLQQNSLSSFNEFLKKASAEGKKNVQFCEAIDKLWELEEAWDSLLMQTVASKV